MNRSQPNVRSRESRAARNDFWLRASEPSLDAIWDNCEDDIYAELLETPVIMSSTELLGTFEEILSAALELPPERRAMLAEHLLLSLDGPNQKQIDAA